MAFMAGRYGGDNLSRFTIGLSWVFIILAIIVKDNLGSALNSIAMVLIGISLFRSLSRNTYKRSAENYKFMTVRNKVMARFSGIRKRLAQSRDYRFFKCPSCGVTTRVPKGRGKIKIRCPRCNTEFIRKS